MSLLIAYKNKNILILLLMFIFTAASHHCEAKQSRSSAAIDEFKRQHPCPSTGAHRGSCKGYIIDHRQALCVGGEDKPSNMRWMTVADAKVKDRWECKSGWEEKLKQCEAMGCFVE
jgi:hypothetical protein